MTDFDLSLNPLPAIDENGSLSLMGMISGLDNPGGEITLNIDWGDPLSPPQNQSFLLKDDGTNGDLVAGDGIIQFTVSKQYLDDNPTATPFDNYIINVDAQEEFLVGTDAVFVIDVSGSTRRTAQGISVGDQNNDGLSNTILDAEIAAFKSLNQELIDRGLGNTARVSVSAYSTNATLLDLDPAAAGIQTFTTPLADADNNGVRDVDQALMSLNYNGFTNFEAGLQQAINGINAAGTLPGDGNVIFLSDGFRNRGGSVNDEVDLIRNTLGQNLRAFGVGSGSSLSNLQEIDPNAVKFTNIQDLLDLFGGAGAGTNQDSASVEATVNNVAPMVDIALSASSINENDFVTVTGSFSDPGILDTHTATINWGDGTGNQTLTLNDDKTFSATYQYLDDGSFGGTPQNGTPSDNYTITVQVTDDDTGVGEASTIITVNDLAPEISSLTDNLPGFGIIVEGDTLELSAEYTDVGTKDFHTAVFDWGDGEIDSSLENPLEGSIGNVSGSHIYDTGGNYTATLKITDDDSLFDVESLDVSVAKKVDIDWKPGSNPSAMNFKGNGVIPVAVLGSENFDVSSIDVASIRADDEKDELLNGGGVGVKEKKNGSLQFSYKDTNSDGFEDLVLQFSKPQLGAVVQPNTDPFLSDNQIYLFGAIGDDGYFFGMQQEGDPIKVV